VSGLGGGGGAPKPPGGLRRPGAPLPPNAPPRAGTAVTPAYPGTVTGLRVDRAALDRALDGRAGRPQAEDPGALGRVGDEHVPASVVAAWSDHLVAEHLMILLARLRGELDREEVVRDVGDRLIAIDDRFRLRKILNAMPDAGRIVDVYPLELATYVLERRPELLDDAQLHPFVRNREAVESTVHRVEEPISIRLPVALKLKMFALEGGGSPGYFLYPGAPDEYRLELGDAGEFRLLLRGDVRRQWWIDRLTIRVEDEPEAD
jgi:hypothetical protein